MISNYFYLFIDNPKNEDILNKTLRIKILEYTTMREHLTMNFNGFVKMYEYVDNLQVNNKNKALLNFVINVKNFLIGKSLIRPGYNIYDYDILYTKNKKRK